MVKHLGALSLLFTIAAMITLAGCPICPSDELKVIEGTLPAQPGADVQFEMRYGDDTYSGDAACELHWYVNQIEGGDDQVGRITNCGRYTAPMDPQVSSVRIGGHTYQLGNCADCCPGAGRDIELAR